MITLLFCILMVAVFGKLAAFAFRAAWGITKILVCFLLAPLLLIGIALAGFMYVALFLLVIGGVISFVAARV